MSGNVLIIDDDLESLEITKKKLLTNYYNVYSSSDSTEAMDILSKNLIDVILLDIMMPKINGFELCTKIRSNPSMQYIPIVMFTAYNDVNNKDTSFQCGADYFLSKPIDVLSFSFKIKPLIRVKKTIDELRINNNLNIEEINECFDEFLKSFKSIIVTNSKNKTKELESCIISLSPDLLITNIPTEEHFTKKFDIIFVDYNSDIDPFATYSQFYGRIENRNSIFVLMVDNFDLYVIGGATNMGFDDFLVYNSGYAEVISKIKIQLKRKFYQDLLKKDLFMSSILSIKDSLTNAYNERYLEKHLKNLINKANNEDINLYLIILDIDDFKQVNDMYGHLSGDSIIVQVYKKILQSVRETDLVFRCGGEEFAVVIYDEKNRDIEIETISNRILESVNKSDFKIEVSNINDYKKTVSIGVTKYFQNMSYHDFIYKADLAMYKAKKSGKNKICYDT